MLLYWFGPITLFTCTPGRCAGKEITLLMQTLNTLSTPDEKLAGLCKKYAELVRGLLHRLHMPAHRQRAPLARGSEWETYDG